jgi:hypothetical protein
LVRDSDLNTEHARKSVLLAAARAQLKDTSISAEQAKKLRAECEALGP